jgi:MFS transporter, DHA1 family, tetracycline resistance protein
MMYAFTIVYCLGGIAGPALQGIMSTIVPPNEQGELQGGFTSLMSLSAILGPFMMNSLLFAYFTGTSTPYYFPGAAMAVGAVMVTISTVLARHSLKKHQVA